MSPPPASRCSTRSSRISLRSSAFESLPSSRPSEPATAGEREPGPFEDSLMAVPGLALRARPGRRFNFQIADLVLATHSRPSFASEGDGAPRKRTVHFGRAPQSAFESQPCRARNASRRSVAASLRSGPRFRVGDSGFALRKTPIVRQPSSWRAVLLPPGGAPEPPGAVLARHDSGRRILLRSNDASRERPS